MSSQQNEASMSMLLGERTCPLLIDLLPANSIFVKTCSAKWKTLNSVYFICNVSANLLVCFMFLLSICVRKGIGSRAENIVSRIHQNPRPRSFSQYRKVSSIESSISSIVDTEKLWFFCQKNLYIKAKNTHFWKFKTPDSLPPLFRKNS